MLKIYGIPLSPFVRKVHWALAYKEVEFESVSVMPGDESAEFRAMSPIGKIPAMDHDGFTVSDSSIILRYLDSVFPDKPLYPQDPQQNAKVSWLEEFADTKLVDACAVFFRERLINPVMMKKPADESAIEDAQANLMPPLLSYLEGQVQEAGYFFGDSLSAADLGITSAFVNARYGDYQVEAGQYPRLASYLDRAMQSPLVTGQAAIEQEIMKSFG